MRVYHFVNLENGLDDLQRRALKIATLNELNDPFELFGIKLSDPALRQAFRHMKEKMATDRGLLCFSRNWQNPVQWSHYAKKHSGLCLGFDFPDDLLAHVNYSGRRIAVATENFLHPRQIDESVVTQLLPPHRRLALPGLASRLAARRCGVRHSNRSTGPICPRRYAVAKRRGRASPGKISRILAALA